LLHPFSALTSPMDLDRACAQIEIVGNRLIRISCKRISLRGSIVGTRKDLAEAIVFATEGKVRAHIHKAKLQDINKVFDSLRDDRIDGRIVLTP